MAAYCAEFGPRWPPYVSTQRVSGGKVDRPCSFDMRAERACLPAIFPARRRSVVTATATSQPKPSSAPSETQGPLSLHIPLLSANEVHAALLARPPHPQTPSFAAFYSSVVGGITKDPSAMVLPVDDHMVHRGHGVFDTALIFDGYLYELDAHLDRILVSAAKAKIPFPASRQRLRDILIRLASAANISRGNLRYWISAGTGGFSLSLKECSTSHFYAMAIANPSLGHPPRGVSVVTSCVPIKPPQFASMKSVNYLPNCLLMLEAEQAGAAASIWLDQEGFVGEGQSMNCAFVTKEGELLVPRFDPILAGCTMKRVMWLAEQLVGSSGLLTGIRFGKVTVEEGRSASEMMLCGSGVLVEPVLQWDEERVGDGTAGEVTLKLRALLDEDLASANDPQRILIPSWGGDS